MNHIEKGKPRVVHRWQRMLWNRGKRFLAQSMLCVGAALLIVPLFSGCSSARSSSVVINEVVSSNSKSLIDPVLGSADWIELYNPSDRDVNLAGYRLTDKLKSNRGILSGATIKAGGYLLVYADKNKTPVDAGTCCIDYNLPQSGQSLYLINPANVVICEIAVPALLTDESYARRDDGTYGYCAVSTPGKKNDSTNILASEALQATLKTGELKLNEVLPKSADGDAWVELYNAGKTDVDLSAYCLSDNQTDATKWHLPARMLAAGEYAVVHFTGKSGKTDAMNATFRLGSKDSAIYLYDISGSKIGGITWQAGIPAGISVLLDNQYTATPTPGKENSKQTFKSATPAAMDASDPVRLSEVLPKNKYSIMDSDRERSEWVELTNSGAQAVSLSGYYISDKADDPLRWAFPADAKIEAGGYLVVFLSGKQSRPGELHAAFRLSQTETGIYLTDIKNYKTDTLALPGEIGIDISVGRDESGKPQYYAIPTPGGANAKGTADLAQLGSFDKTGVYISEVSAAANPKTNANDWIELHNGGSADVDITGYYLSDSANDPKKWQIPKLSIPANGYVVIEATSNSVGRSKTTAAFGISPSGETLLLSNAAGFVVDAFETGELKAGMSSGRVESNNALPRVYFTTPTPGAANPAQYQAAYAASPVFSETSLYHSAAFKLSITSDAKGAKIYYTTDGSSPTKSSKAYAGPISVSKSTPVRAVAYAPGCLPSDVATATYLFDEPHTLPVFCISGKPGEMNTVIKDNTMHYKPEYGAYVEYYDKTGAPMVSFPSAIRPKGNWSITFPQNSLVLNLQGSYGQKDVTYPFFPDSKVTTFSALALRASGEDYNAARMRDTYFQRVDKGMDVNTIETKLVAVYVNGAYNGLYDLVEQSNTDYLASHFNVNSNDIEMVNHDDTVLQGSNKEFIRVSALAQSLDLSNDDALAELSKYVDMDACIDWLVAQTYFANGDVINQRFWRTKDYSLKWRPMLFDLDFSMRYNNVNRNTFSDYFQPVPIGPDYPIVDNRIFRALKKNKAWCDKFVQRYIQLAETQYSPDRILNIFDNLKSEMQPEMPRHIAKWHIPSSMSAWNNQAAQLRSVLKNRQPVALKQLQSYFHVSDAKMQEYIAKYSVKN